MWTTNPCQSLRHSCLYTVSVDVLFENKKSINSGKLECTDLAGFGCIKRLTLRKIYALTTERSSAQFSITSWQNSRLLWHILSDIRTHLVISMQYSSTRDSCIWITSKILLKHRTDERRLKGSGWFELLAILRIRERILVSSTI